MLGQSASGPNHTFPRQVYLFKSVHPFISILADMLTNQQFGEIMAIENNPLAIQ